MLAIDVFCYFGRSFSPSAVCLTVREKPHVHHVHCTLPTFFHPSFFITLHSIGLFLLLVIPMSNHSVVVFSWLVSDFNDGTVCHT